MKHGATLETERLIIRHWTLSEIDREAFHFLMSDETIRKFYVTRLTRQEADERLERHVAGVEKNGFDWAVACLKETGEPVGFTGLSNVPYETPFTPCVEIGWLYKPKVWGTGLATEAGQALLKHGFKDLELAEIVAFAVHDNRSSLAVMERLGMTRDPLGDFDHPIVPQSHPHLNPHVLYRATAPGSE